MKLDPVFNSQLVFEAVVFSVFQEFYSMVDLFAQLGSSLRIFRVGQYKEHRSVLDVLVYQEKTPHC